MHRLQRLFLHRGRGIYSVCSAHRWAIHAAVEQCIEDQSLLLVEATSNQVNQAGGYTGMHPLDFRHFVEHIAIDAGFPLENLVLGGDHLGPNPWRHLPAEQAMQHAEVMVKSYAEAGFTKIHLDTSISCSDDPAIVSDEIVAARAARLAAVAEEARSSDEAPVYVIGTEVPTPGGATHSLDGELQATTVAAAQHTWDVHLAIFSKSVQEICPRILALVVQPGVEFNHASVVEYDHKKARSLASWLRTGSGPRVFEAHSTDYQLPEAYTGLIRDGFGILKVGPALTFALREALFALENIERVLIKREQCSNLADTLDKRMREESREWVGHYHGSEAETAHLRRFSYSDRVRYYWNQPDVKVSLNLLLQNLEAINIPETVLSQFLPVQYERVRRRLLLNKPLPLLREKIREVLRGYARACNPDSNVAN